MSSKQRQIFRQESLARLGSGDDLDHLLHVVQPRSWMALVASAVLLSLALAWSVVGRVPVRVEGVALLTHPERMLPFRAPVRARVAKLRARPHQQVRAGEVLVELKLPELEAQIDLQRERIASARRSRADVLQLERELAGLDRDLFVSQARELARRREVLASNREEFEQASAAVFGQLRAELSDAQRISRRLLAQVELAQESFESLQGPDLRQADGFGGTPVAASHAEDRGVLEEEVPRRLVSTQQVLVNLTLLTEQSLRSLELNSKEKELTLEETRTRQTLDGMLDRMGDLSHSMQDVEVELRAIDGRLEIRALEDRALIEGYERELDLLLKRREEQGTVRAQAAGVVLELLQHPGELVEAGQRLGRLELPAQGNALSAVAYFPIESGKRVQVGDVLHVTPDTVERARFGAIRARVLEVSRYPVSREAAAHRLGAPELADLLLRGPSRIEVLAELELAPELASGYRWTSGAGPDEPVTEGTTANVRVTVERRAPITFVLPFLESWIGP